jgi:DNA polymerase-4
MKKPDAVTVISEENFKEKVWGLPVGDLLYVGSSTLSKLNNLAIYTIGDLACFSPSLLKRHFGKWGEILWYFANGYDSTPVTRLDYENSIKSIGNSLTTPRDLETNEEARILLYILSESVGERLRKHRLAGRTVQITIRDSSMACIERQAPLGSFTNVTSEIAEKAYEIFFNSWDWSRTIRLLGVRVTNLVLEDRYVQLSLFADPRHSKRERLDSCVDIIRDRFGQNSVQRAYLLNARKEYPNPVEDNIIHPVSFFGK